MIDASLKLFNAGLIDHTALRQKTLVSSDWIAFLPELEQLRRHRPGVIMGRMSGHPERFALNQSRPTPGPSPLDRSSRSVPNRKNIVAVDDLARHSISLGAIGHVFHCHLPF